MTFKLGPGRFEVSGFVVKSYVQAFRLIRHVPHTILAKHGVGTIDPSGEFSYDPASFYPLDKVLAAIHELDGAVGPKKMFEIGLEIPKNAVLPPGASDLPSAMSVFDAGYHLNHRKDGAVMFDATKRAMVEGIGHYKCASIDPKRIVMEVDGPYPCELDRGIMQSWAARFERTASIVHMDPHVCRMKGASRCRYELSWK